MSIANINYSKFKINDIFDQSIYINLHTDVFDQSISFDIHIYPTIY